MRSGHGPQPSRRATSPPSRSGWPAPPREPSSGASSGSPAGRSISSTCRPEVTSGSCGTRSPRWSARSATSPRPWTTGEQSRHRVPAFVPPTEALARLRREIDRTAVRATNGLKHLSGFSSAEVGQTPREAVWSRDKVTLYRYSAPAAPPRHSPVLLVMSLVTRPYVFDLRPGNSLVARLVEDGHDVYLLDWGIPDAVEAGNTLETYCDEYLPHACRAVLETSD